MIATNMAGRGTDIKLGAITRERCWTTGSSRASRRAR
jgi:preprotein translocase subunit SecA